MTLFWMEDNIHVERMKSSGGPFLLKQNIFFSVKFYQNYMGNTIPNQLPSAPSHPKSNLPCLHPLKIHWPDRRWQ